MKYILLIALALSVVATSVSASTGTTSTGTTAPALTCLTGLPCAGGPTRAFNYTKNADDMYPQCFPWTWLSNFQRGSIFDIYTNQKACQVQRSIDFRM